MSELPPCALDQFDQTALFEVFEYVDHLVLVECWVQRQERPDLKLAALDCRQINNA